MQSTSLTTIRAPWRVSSAFWSTILMFCGAVTTFSQPPMAPMGRPAPATTGVQNKQLADQIAEMRAEIARLQAAVDQTGTGNGTNASPPMQMGAKKSMGMMGGEMGGMMQGMKGMEGEMGGMGAMPPAGGMAAPAKAMGMCCMGMMGLPPGGNAGMTAPAPAPPMAGMTGSSSAMPGQPGASHLLHIGSTGFFLNHAQHITLTADQRAKLNRLKEKAMLEQASEQRKIDQAEQEVYSLTGADQADTSKIQAKISEIEKRRSEQRMNFIQAVSEASNVLTHDQHRALMGTMPSAKQ